jgi:hypothetical protein
MRRGLNHLNQKPVRLVQKLGFFFSQFLKFGVEVINAVWMEP